MAPTGIREEGGETVADDEHRLACDRFVEKLKRSVVHPRALRHLLQDPRGWYKVLSKGS